MLHEILLSLSGIPSTIWKDLTTDENTDNDHADAIRAYISPPEREMVQVLAELADLHIKVREATTRILGTHPSPTCRAVSSRIKTVHLRAFTKKVIDVETSILQEDAKFVGAYNIVPLSAIVTEFQPWTRPLRWLWKTTQILTPRNAAASCTACKILDFLQKEGHTGYVDLRDLSTDLLISAQQAWIQSLTPWILYGQLPHFGADDFMVEADSSRNISDYALRMHLIPYFVDPDAAQAILAIGKALNQIKSRSWSDQGVDMSSKTCTSLMPSSLKQVKSLSYPIESNEFAHAMNAINKNISQAALSYLLPTELIYEFLLTMQDYVLFRNGEFAMALIKQSEEYLQAHQMTSNTAKPVRKLGKLNDLTINDTDLSAIFNKTWSEFSALISDREFETPMLGNVSTWLCLRSARASLPISTLLPTPSSLDLNLPADSPLHIFVSQTDMTRYCGMNAYLISIRRAETQIAKLWQISSQRRCYPTPLGPPFSATRQGQQILQTRREREEQRSRTMRTHWACASQVLFLLSEMGNYFHGEVITNSWVQLQTWLDVKDPGSRPTSSRLSSRPTTASSSLREPSDLNISTSSNPSYGSTHSHKPQKADPRSIATVNQKYLDALYHSLLISNSDYIATLRDLLTTIDHFVALFHRQQTIWQGLDLQQDEGIRDVLANYAKEERELAAEMTRTNGTLLDQLHELVGTIREAERQRNAAEMTAGVSSLGISATTSGHGEFEPWRARTLDRLLMKLDFLAGEREERFEDALVDAEDD